ncbi:MAG: peptidylprolyl isomerase [Spirochaetaceae bacterium]|nr:MAG: peptidylprolyl isomerase [Spirochaetaceae bacterium]
MTVQDNTIVSINYTLTDDSGSVIDSSEQRDPLSFFFGAGTIIPGLEKALAGKSVGDSLDVVVEPAEAYGEYNDQLVFAVPADRIQDAGGLEVGAQVQAQTADGQTQVLTVKAVSDDDITLDANHPLAGETLHFAVEITDVRQATDEEIAQNGRS